MDPCDLRLTKGDAAVLDLIDTRRPMFEFAIRSAIAAVDLDTVEGQVSALGMAAPVVARTRDRAMRPEYARRLSDWLGMDERTVLRAVHDAARAEGREARPRPGEERPAPQRAGEGEGAGEEPVIPVARLSDVVSPRDPVGQVEVQSLAVMLQSPVLLSAQQVGALPDDAFHVPALQGVWDVMLAAGTLLRRRRHAQPGSLSRPGARDRRGDGTPPDRGDHESRPARSGRAGPGAAGGIFAGPPQRAVHHP